jgi:hypothetical protein
LRFIHFWQGICGCLKMDNWDSKLESSNQFINKRSLSLYLTPLLERGQCVFHLKWKLNIHHILHILKTCSSANLKTAIPPVHPIFYLLPFIDFQKFHITIDFNPKHQLQQKSSNIIVNRCFWWKSIHTFAFPLTLTKENLLELSCWQIFQFDYNNFSLEL